MVVLNNQYLPPKSLVSIILKQRVKWVNTVNVVPSGSRKLLKLPWRGTVRFPHASFKIKRRIKWFSITCILWMDILILCSILWVFHSLSPLHIVGYHFVLFWAWKITQLYFPLSSVVHLFCICGTTLPHCSWQHVCAPDVCQCVQKISLLDHLCTWALLTSPYSISSIIYSTTNISCAMTKYGLPHAWWLWHHTWCCHSVN